MFHSNSTEIEALQQEANKQPAQFSISTNSFKSCYIFPKHTIEFQFFKHTDLQSITLRAEIFAVRNFRGTNFCCTQVARKLAHGCIEPTTLHLKLEGK